MTEIQAISLAQHVRASTEKTASLILEMKKLVQYCQDKDKDCYKQGFVGMRKNTVFQYWQIFLSEWLSLVCKYVKIHCHPLLWKGEVWYMKETEPS